MFFQQPSNATPPKTFSSGLGLGVTVLLLAAVVLACSFGPSNKCTATLSYQGKTYTGADAKSEKAVSNACNKYCRDDDPGYEAMYRIWLGSPAGQAAGRPSKEQAIYKSERLLDYVTITCANKCVGWTKDGTAKVDTKCD